MADIKKPLNIYQKLIVSMADVKKPLNIYQKLTKARYSISKKKLTKSGYNEHSNYYYYELSDILPSIIEVNNDIGLIGIFNIYNISGVETAQLSITNCENPSETIVFEIPTAEVQIAVKKDGTGGAQPIQNLGGKTTYIRRYLYLIAYDIAEPDLVDSSNNNYNAKLKKNNKSNSDKKEIEVTHKNPDQLQHKDIIKIGEQKYKFIRSKYKTGKNAGKEYTALIANYEDKDSIMIFDYMEDYATLIAEWTGLNGLDKFDIKDDSINFN